MYDRSVMPQSVVSSAFSTGRVLRTCGAILLVVGLAACGSNPKGGAPASSASPQRGTYKVGAPYKIDGVTYTPQEEFNRTETGVASWYGPGFHGKSTANGERYDQSDRTAAHRTLQMPAVVRVTNLDNGMSTVVRINDRGPFARNRVIDLSRTAAQEINMIGNGTARVRLEQLPNESMAVRDVALAGGGPSEQHAAMAQAAAGQRPSPAAASPPPPVMQASAAPPSPAPAAAPSATPTPTPAERGWSTTPRAPSIETQPAAGRSTVASLAAVPPAVAASGFYVQTGAFTTPENAERQRGAVRSYGSSEVLQGSAGGRGVWRVRLGPYTTQDAAGIVADRLRRSGFGDARVVQE